ncbi:FAD-dependent oxidoreductase [Jatrophihabitans sp.]|uniref:NAD(P)/FAD-dependent oxidoreductase n=1 Tax=Jatrophihabitans sp. TaxID=1932789 RepID=UPI0030C75AE8|nr:Rhodocoxin reductase [Jatrophihabitans sp.]
MPQPVRRVVIIGAGLAGLRTAERLRERGFAGVIELLGAEQHLPYDRPPLSKAVLRGERGETVLRAEAEFDALRVQPRLGEAAVAIDVAAGVVHTKLGEVAYDAVVIATGAVPRRLAGIEGHVLRTLDDALALREALRPGVRLAVIGAGLVGCEVAASARAMGVEVDLVDVLAGPMIRVVGPAVAGLVAQLHAEQGVHLHLGADPADVARLAGEADEVLVAVGAVPDTGWLAGSDVAVGDGVLCDADGVAAPGVYAVGDVASWAGRRHEHWTRAGEQADHVAALITGQPVRGPQVAYWWSDQYGLKLQGLGSPSADDDVEVLQWGPKARTVAVYSRNGALTGVVGFAAAAAIMRLRGEIEAGADVAGVIASLRG